MLIDHTNTKDTKMSEIIKTNYSDHDPILINIKPIKPETA